MDDPLIAFTDAGFRKYDRPVFPHTTWKLSRGEHWAVTGANGSGKTTFLEIINRQWLTVQGEAEYRLPKEAVATVWFNDGINYDRYYYQQRYHATETEGITTVRKFLQLQGDIPDELIALNMLPLLDREIIKLSNGQFKKMLIVKALLKNPRLLLLDNLFTGLDAKARTFIADTLTRIAGIGTQIIMTADAGAWPAVVTHVMETVNSRLHAAKRAVEVRPQPQATVQRPSPTLPAAPDVDFTTVARMNGVTIRYGSHTVLDRIQWHIRHGEKWALTGPNGAGKSMLLSLIFADHPQAYANNIILFDRQRGSGESIWDIKDKTGFVSPEMHLYNRRNISCTELVMEGLHGNPYLRHTVTAKETQFARELFAFFSLTDVAGSSFQRISTGQQNTTLLIRALVKNPPVLILDEPFQGMDAEKIALARRLLDEYCRRRTLIFVSHQPEELPDCIHRCLYIDRGKAEERPVPSLKPFQA
ncbi:MAG: ATP-binding cassette domain-containing protein [Bacteroidales bacterium]|jgi:molybdate transport system ATP-binding protein|nr:ATP-binding cassette domain-containing protein [Bacteroidales bacterium]